MSVSLRILLALALGIAQSSMATTSSRQAEKDLAALPEHPATTRSIVQVLSSRHYVRNELNNNLSSQVFDAYIGALDPSRSFLLENDIAGFEIYRYLMDDTLRRGNLGPAYKMFNRHRERVIARFEKNIETLENHGMELFDFSLEESLQTDREAAPWAKQESELDALWHKRLKNAFLGLKLAGKEPEEIRTTLLKRYQNRLTRFRQTNSEDVFQLYMNAFTSTFDPHTQYFSPRTSENFNINMSLSLEGIGAVLQAEDEYIKVVRLVPGGPADKTDQIHPNDKITGVAQGLDGEMIDVIGWRLDDVVDMIRGKKDSIVRIRTIPFLDNDADESRVIQITRNKVKLEDQSAKSEIQEVDHFGSSYRIGIISIPTFYIDFQALQKGDPNYRSTTRDVRRLLETLQKEENIDGVVIDLRDNSGGSLQEANSLVGLFIDRGPTVQIQNSRQLVDVLRDREKGIAYGGPLAVLVNRLSASASEIFAGAIQDYQRGLILGTTTFGKGTVQSLMPLSHGQLKLTQAKFYRISGESTQHQGITPDIIFPARYDSESIGESALDEPLPWDSIQAAPFQPISSLNELIPDLRALHQARTTDNQEFHFLRESIRYRKQQTGKSEVSLNEAARREKKETTEEFWVSLENRRREARGQSSISSLDELEQEPTLAGTGGQAQGVGITVGDEAEGASSAGGEMAVLNPPVTEGTSGMEEGADNASNLEEAAAETDALLQESSRILVDLISLGPKTAGAQKLDSPI